METTGLQAKKQPFLKQLTSLQANFWSACFMEILERLAFFGSRAVAPLYLVASSSQNGLDLNYKEKGVIYTVWALLQCLIPMVSGGYTDRYGYRKSLSVAFLINVVGYSGMAMSKPIADHLATMGWEHAGFWVFMAAACCVATGTAIFKPPAHGTIAKTTTEETSSLGWGIFYWVVNIGGALAPMGAATLRREIDWHIVFWAAAVVTALNFIPAFLFYREPAKTPPKEGEEQPHGPVGVFVHSIATILKDFRLIVFLGIFSCFWLMFMQLWDLLPNFIDEWVDTSRVAKYFEWFSSAWVLGSGQVKPEMIINIDAIAIILLVIPISALIGKISKVAAMILGMVISLFAFVASGATMLGWFCCLAIFIFAIGEMICSPTFSAYVGLIAPPDKKALYMGYSNIPFAIGWALGNLLGGFVYEDYGARANLAMRELASSPQLVAKAARAADWSDSLEKIPDLLKIDRDAAFSMVQADLDVDGEAAARMLRQTFRCDAGQTENLCLQYLALHPDNRAKTTAGFAKALASDAAAFSVAAIGLSSDIEKQSKERAASTQPTTSIQDEKERPLDKLDKTLKEMATLSALLRQLTDPARAEEPVDLASHVHRLPDVLGIQRTAVMEKVRELVNKDVPRGEWKQDSDIAAMLWEQHGQDAQVLNNLALEYLAQATGRLETAVGVIEFKASSDMKKRAKELEERVGIDSQKAFAALSAAVAAGEPMQSGSSTSAPTEGSSDGRVYLELIANPKDRFDAVAKRDWRYDLGLLRSLVSSDPEALKIVRQEIDRQGIVDAMVSRIAKMFSSDDYEGEVSSEGINYYKLACRKELVQKALAAKDWSRTPDQARSVLGLNPHEALSLWSQDRPKATQLLWDKYHPYQVWYYLGFVGLLGTIGMIIFYFVTKPRSPART